MKIYLVEYLCIGGSGIFFVDDEDNFEYVEDGGRWFKEDTPFKETSFEGTEVTLIAEVYDD